jgi:hypothetical protein
VPSSTPRQARFMRAVAHGWKPPGGKAPPVSVAKEFMRADQAKSKGRRTREQVSDRKRATSEWAEGKRTAP